MAGIEGNRWLYKRTDISGITPTINTGSTIPYPDWTPTDIMVGEAYLNTVDDLMWVRTDNGIIELPLNVLAYYTTGATLSGTSILFDRSDSTDAYSIDLAPIIGSASLPLNITGNTTVAYGSNTVTLSGSTPWVYDADYSASYGPRSIVDKSYVDSVSITGDTVVDDFSATTVSVLNSGTTARDYFDYSENTVETNVTNSAIVGGSGNTIVAGVRNVFVSGVDLTGDTNDTAYFSKLNIDDTSAGESISTLGIDANGNVVTESNSVDVPYDNVIAISDETSPLSAGTDMITTFASRAFTAEKVKLTLSTSGSTDTTIDVHVNGTSILSSPLTLSSGDRVVSTTSFASTSISEDDEITIDISTASDGAGAKVNIIGKINKTI